MGSNYWDTTNCNPNRKWLSNCAAAWKRYWSDRDIYRNGEGRADHSWWNWRQARIYRCFAYRNRRLKSNHLIPRDVVSMEECVDRSCCVFECVSNPSTGKTDLIQWLVQAKKLPEVSEKLPGDGWSEFNKRRKRPGFLQSWTWGSWTAAPGAIWIASDPYPCAKKSKAVALFGYWRLTLYVAYKLGGLLRLIYSARLNYVCCHLESKMDTHTDLK